jgi:hypothetical protein
VHDDSCRIFIHQSSVNLVALSNVITQDCGLDPCRQMALDATRALPMCKVVFRFLSLRASATKIDHG